MTEDTLFADIEGIATDIRDLTARDVRGGEDLTADERAYLRRNLAAWKLALTTIKRRCELHVASLATDLLTYQQECLRRGTYDARNDFFSFKAEVQERQRRTNAFRTRVDERLALVKLAISQQADETQWVQGYRAGYRDAIAGITPRYS